MYVMSQWKAEFVCIVSMGLCGVLVLCWDMTILGHVLNLADEGYAWKLSERRTGNFLCFEDSDLSTTALKKIGIRRSVVHVV